VDGVQILSAGYYEISYTIVTDGSGGTADDAITLLVNGLEPTQTPTKASPGQNSQGALGGASVTLLLRTNDVVRLVNGGSHTIKLYSKNNTLSGVLSIKKLANY
jgi:hypothetical protein